MEKLKSLLSFIEKSGIKKSDNIRKHSKCNKLYDLLIQSNKSDKIIFNEIFGQNYNVSSTYKLTSKLMGLLIENIQKHDFKTNSHSNFTIAKIEGYNNLALVNTLLHLNEPKLSIFIATKTLKSAIKYELIDLIVLLSTHIINKSRIYDGNSKDYNKAYLILAKYQKIQLETQQISIWYGEIAYLYKSSKGSNTEILITKLTEYCNEILLIREHNNTYLFNIMAYIMLSTLYILTKEYTAAIKNANSALEFLSTKSFTPPRTKRSFVNDIVIANIMLGDFELNANSLIKNKKVTPVGSHNYFNISSYQFINYTVDEKYDFLPNLCTEAISHKTIKNNRLNYELWNIRLAYVFFLHKTGKLKTTDTKITNFRTRKMLNDVPLFTKDKKGMHNSIKIIEIILLLNNRKYNDLIDKEASLRVYYDTYLKGKKSYRNRLFFKMIRIMILKSNFHPVRAEQLTKNTYDKLKSTKYDFIQLEQEIIPYEKLWPLIIQLLDINWKNKKG